ncbi:MAG: hypothetical protein JWQ42_4714 [Edaphobacter sp.]|nr:hypothetical protein [Edaphobacter sp.]
MDIDRFVTKYPKLYHMAAPENLDAMRVHGLLSTCSLTERFGCSVEVTKTLLYSHRAKPLAIEHPKYGRATVRDQHPLSPKKLAGLLRDGLTVEDYLKLINGRVFFWCDRRRLDSMRSAYAGRQCVLTIDSRKFLSRYWRRVEICRYNSSDTRANKPRTRPLFEDLSMLDRDALSDIAEVTVPGEVPDVFEFVESEWVGTSSETLA